LSVIDLKNSVFVGDSLKDIEAARAAGVRPVLVLTGSGKKTLESLKSLNTAAWSCSVLTYQQYSFLQSTG
jgi:histidinol phosphatase-like enzyme